MTTTTSTATIETTSLSPERQESLRLAAEFGADAQALATLAAATRLSRAATIVLPRHHLETLSRGRGWCRQGRGADAVWGERTEQGYRVGPGTWVVGGHDGFARKRSDTWVVRHVQVGAVTWTIAD